MSFFLLFLFYFLILQYVEERFKSKALRKITVIMTLLQGYIFTGFLLHPPAIFLQFLTNVPPLATLFIVGISSTIYSSFVSFLNFKFAQKNNSV